ncbi:MAG: pyridoxal phosphate-dependent aminotransferase [bacterium]
MSVPPMRFDDDAVDMALLRQRAYNLRWATLPPDVIALTAADPDFPVAEPIRRAIADYAAGGVFSYGPPEGLPAFRTACAHRYSERRGVRVGAGQVLAVDSAAAGMMHIARLVLEPGDEAIVFDPVDFLFKASVEAAGGRVRLLPVDPASGRLDLSRLRDLVTPRTRLLGVCNPVNPVGRVLTRDELAALGAFAVEHDLVIMNDEIWSDIVYEPGSLTSIAAISPEVAARTFTVHGFSKTFGLAGLRIGFVIAHDASRFESLLEVSRARTTMTGAATLSQVAATAAYEECWPWADAFVAHLRTMRDLGVARLSAIPGVHVRPPEGTYVLFPDVRALGVPAEELARRLLDEGRVAVVPGAARWFGPGAEGHLRIVFSTSRRILEQGLDRIEGVLRAL